MNGCLTANRGSVGAPIGAISGPAFGASWPWVRFHWGLGASLRDGGRLTSSQGSYCKVLVQGPAPFIMMVPARNGFDLAETLELLDKVGVDGSEKLAEIVGMS